MREDGKNAAFETYAAARWTALVRTIALLGTPDPWASAVARAALVRTRTTWAGRDRIDPDIATCMALVSERRVTARWWVDAPPREPMAPRRADLESRLDRLTVEDRAALLVHALWGIESHGDPGGGPDVEEVRAVAETIRVDPFSATAVAESVRDQERVRRRRTVPPLVALAALVALFVGTTTLGGSPRDPREQVPRATDPAIEPPARRSVTRVDVINPAPVTWYAQGSLHLPEETLEIPTVRSAARLGSGAVFLTYAGQLAVVDDRGSVEVLADLSDRGQAASFVADSRSGLVAWVERERPDPEVSEFRPFSLVVHDTTRSIDLLRLLVRSDASPVAVEPRAVSFNQDAESLRVALGRDETVVRAPRREEYVAQSPGEDDIEIDPRQLVASAGPAQAYQTGNGRLEVEHSLLDRPLRIPGFGAEISDDGRFLATRVFEDETNAYGTVRVYALPGGDELETGIDAERSAAIDLALGPGDAVSYLIVAIGPGSGGQIPGEEGSERLDLVTCDLSPAYKLSSLSTSEQCSNHARIPSSGIASFLGQ